MQVSEETLSASAPVVGDSSIQDSDLQSVSERAIWMVSASSGRALEQNTFGHDASGGVRPALESPWLVWVVKAFEDANVPRMPLFWCSIGAHKQCLGAI